MLVHAFIGVMILNSSFVPIAEQIKLSRQNHPKLELQQEGLRIPATLPPRLPQVKTDPCHGKRRALKALLHG